MLNGIGDILCVTPTIQAIKEAYPQAKLSVIVRPHLRSLLRDNPYVDDLIFYDTSRVWKRLIFLRVVRQQKFDLWVDLHVPTFNTVSNNGRDFFRNRMLMQSAGARYRLAYEVEQLRPQLTHRVGLVDEQAMSTTNIVDTTLALMKRQGDDSLVKFIPVNEVNRNWAELRFPASGKVRIAMFFGSRQSADVWPEEYAQELVNRVFEESAETEILLIGGPEQKWLATRLMDSVNAERKLQIFDLVGLADLNQTAALMARCSLVISTDSGPMHIADAQKVPIVALFSAKNHADVWKPVQSQSRVLQRKVDCGPCFLADCPHDNLCMRQIYPGEVMDACREVLAETAGKG